MKREDYCMSEVEGKIMLKSSLFLKKAHGYRFGEQVHASIFDYGSPNFKDWAETYEFKPIPDSLWNDSVDMYKLFMAEIPFEEAEVLFKEIMSRGNIKEGEYEISNPKDHPDYHLTPDELVAKYYKK